jgi:hypothetical protein
MHNPDNTSCANDQGILKDRSMSEIWPKKRSPKLTLELVVTAVPGGTSNQIGYINDHLPAASRDLISDI